MISEKLFQLCLNCVYTAGAILSGSRPHREQSHNLSNFQMKRYVLSRTKLF